jgi:hypothetical protein
MYTQYYDTVPLLIGPVARNLQTNPCQIFFKVRQQPPIHGAYHSLTMPLNHHPSSLKLQQQSIVAQSNHAHSGPGTNALHNSVGNVGRCSGRPSRHIPRAVEANKYQ